MGRKEEQGARRQSSSRQRRLNNGRPPHGNSGSGRPTSHFGSANRNAEALQRSNLQYRLLLESAAEGIVMADSQGRIVFANNRLAEMFRYSRSWLIGRKVEELLPLRARRVHVRERAAFFRHPQQRFMGHESELLGRRKGGEEFPVEVSLSPVPSGDGLMTLALVTDITERVRATQALEQGARRYRALLESIAEGAATVDNSGRMTFANDSLCEMVGYHPRELIGQRVEILVPRGLRAQHGRDRAAYQAHPTTRQMAEASRIVAVSKSGREIPIEVSLTPIETDDGVLTLALISDISRRLQAEQDLRRLAERLTGLHHIDRAILQSRPISKTLVQALTEMVKLIQCDRAGVVALDDSGAHLELLAALGRGADVSGPSADYSAEHIVGSLAKLRRGRLLEFTDLRRLKPTPLLDKFSALGLRSYVAVPLLVEDHLIGALTLWYRTPGKRPAEEMSIAREVAAQLAVAIRQDRLLREARRHAEELERLVDERTRQLKDRNEDLQAFAYSVSHDLRAPLRAMRGFGEALLEDYSDALDDMGKDFIERIVAASGQMDDLIQDILAYSRISQDQISTEPLDLVSVMREVLIMLEADIKRSGGTVDFLPSAVRVMGHRPTLVQALVNLVSNGLKFTRPGVGPTVRVSVVAQEDHARVLVADRGIGIRKGHQERIFRIFERLHSREEYPGTGIGLAIVRRSMERLGGKCGVQSAGGKGSTFWIELPIA
ncbi:MAG TPA: PAS domain S-box protein [Dehalococcoidia bacterium]|nr:PAS domain S-box protein [Dehalococcoidia bacterium]